MHRKALKRNLGPRKRTWWLNCSLSRSR
jgi:hypothetical protein